MPWIFQAFVLAICTLPFAYVRAYDVMLITMVSAFIVYGLAKYDKLISQHLATNAHLADKDKPPLAWRFNLKDLMFGMILFSVLAATISQSLVNHRIAGGDFPITSPTTSVGVGLTLSFWSIGLLAIYNRRLNTLGRKLIFAIALLGMLFWASSNDDEIVPHLKWAMSFASASSPLLNRSTMNSNSASATTWFCFLLIVSSITLFVTWSFRKPKPSNQTSDRSKPSSLVRRLIGYGRLWSAPLISTVLIFSSITSLLCYFVVLLPPTSNIDRIREYQSGQPNGLPELIAAGKKFDQNAILNQSQPVRPGLALVAEIKKHTKTFAMIDSALSKPNCTWIDWSNGELLSCDKSTTGFAAFNDLGNLRAIARALDIRALQAIFDQQYDVAIEDGIRCIRVAESLSTDGCNLTVLIGAAVEGIGSQLMYPAIAHASESQLESANKYLEQLIQSAGSPQEQFNRMIANDALFMWEHMNWKDRALDPFDTDSIFQLPRILLRRSIFRKLLQSEIALARFRMQHGKYPDQLQELVPIYLRTIPLDPGVIDTAPTPLNYSYSAADDSFELYSIGVDGVDDDGRVDKHEYPSHGDINLAKIIDDPIQENEEYVVEYERELELERQEAELERKALEEN